MFCQFCGAPNRENSPCCHRCGRVLASSIKGLHPPTNGQNVSLAGRKGRRRLGIIVAILLMLVVLFVTLYQGYRSNLLAENKAASRRYAESIVMFDYVPTVELARRINGLDIFGTWTVDDLETCILLPKIQPCEQRVRLIMTARDRRDHHQTLVVAPSWILHRDGGEEPENEDASKSFQRYPSYNESDPFFPARRFVNDAVNPAKAFNEGMQSIMSDLKADIPLTSFFLPPMFEHDATCPNCYLVRYLWYLDGREYEGIFRVNVDTDYIEGLNDTANDRNVFSLLTVRYGDKEAARKIIFGSYDPNFNFPAYDDKYDRWEFAKSPACKKCFYVSRRIIQPVGPSSYRTFDCRWEVNVETGVSEALTPETRIAFRRVGAQNPFETVYGNALEPK